MNIPAFPTVMIGEIEGGMTLRDYFAAQAMQAILKNYDPVTAFDSDEIADPEGMPVLIAQDAYIMADFMLKERRK
jgi:hypothetical protein